MVSLRALSIRITWLFLGALFAPGIASCKGGNIHDVYTALDASGDRKRSRFYTDTVSIFCDAEYSGTKHDVTIKALIRARSLNGVTKNRIIAQNEQTPAPSQKTILSFELVKASDTGADTKADPWPPGDFDCEIYENGTLEATTSFSIVIPSCPDGPAIAGAVCRGFYPDGVRCPAPDKGALCTCGINGTWEGC